MSWVSRELHSTLMFFRQLQSIWYTVLVGDFLFFSKCSCISHQVKKNYLLFVCLCVFKDPFLFNYFRAREDLLVFVLTQKSYFKQTELNLIYLLFKSKLGKESLLSVLSVCASDSLSILCSGLS